MPLSSTMRQLGAAVRMLTVMTLLLGVLYPAVIWGAGQVSAPRQAHGSLIERNGVVVGSSLLGQNVTDHRLFHGRPSASQYAGGVSGGSNLYSSASEQQAAVAERQSQYAVTNGGMAAPADALTASASGLDPDVSQQNAMGQAARVAANNGLSEEVVKTLVRQHTQGRLLGFLGQPRVNVLELNLALETLAGR